MAESAYLTTITYTRAGCAVSERKEVAAENAVRFGRFLAELRGGAGMSQIQAVAQAVGGSGPERLSLTQASLARLELGQTTPRPEVLLALSHVYGIAFDRMISAYLSIVMFGQDVPKHFDWPRVGVPDQQSLKERPFFASNRLEAWSLDEVLEWERSLLKSPPPLGLWIISTNFVDHKDSRISDLVVDLVAAGACVTYFITSELVVGSPFDLLLSTVVMGLKNKVQPSDRDKIGEIGLYVLNPFEKGMFTSSLVIGNPDNLDDMADKPCGFTIVSAAGQHQFGIPLLQNEAKQIIDRVRGQIQFRKTDKQFGLWEPNALTNHRMFKEDFSNDQQ